MSSPEQPRDPSMLEAAERAANKALDHAVEETETLNDYYNVDRITDRDQLRAMSVAHYAFASDARRVLSEQFPDLEKRVSELWNEVETARHELEQSTSISEDRRCLRQILFNESRLATLLARPNDEAAESE